MLMVLALFLSMENPKEYYEKSVPNVLNRDAFVLHLAEMLVRKKGFFVLSVIFTGKTNVLTETDRDQLYNLQKAVSTMADSNINAAAYALSWNTLVFVVRGPEKVETFMNLINNYSDPGNLYKMTFSILEIPKCTEELDQAIQILDYVSTEYVYTQSSPNLVIDRDVVDKMIFRNSVEDVVRQAVIDKAFDVYYQPILCVADGSFASAEALVRLRRPNSENYISPEDFIPIAEQCGLVQEIDDLVFEKVCSFIARENLSSYGLKVIEVNLSGNEVVDPQIHQRLRHKMEKYHIPPHFINFEITETSYINNDEVFKKNMQRLREMGSTFSMDDFGSGYSNLLEILKMDYFLVKMDKEFVWRCLDPSEPENLKMLDYTIQFLKEFGLHILAEGVETLDQAKILIDKGVEFLQGFYYSRPIPEEEYLDFLKAQKGIMSSENTKGERL
jgi:EAL domain-containing protein (putative c-di-GMP-specific phosphodiesterase class I)